MLKVKTKGILIVLAIILMSLAILSLAKYLVFSSNDSQTILKETTGVATVTEKPDTTKETEKKPKEVAPQPEAKVPQEEPQATPESKPEEVEKPFDPYYGEDWDEYAKVSVNPDYFNGKIILGDPMPDQPSNNYPEQIYNPEFIHCRMIEFFGDRVSPSDYENICKVLDNSQEYFSKVEPINYDIGRGEELFIDDLEGYDPEKIKGCNNVILQGEVIGFADKNTVLISNYIEGDNNLFLVDFSGYAVNPIADEDFFKLGIHPRIVLDGDKIGVERVGGYIVTVVKL